MEYWQHQNNKPLFPNVLWSRPETLNGAGKLAIMGGSSGAMATLATAYMQAEQAGTGTIRLIVPDGLRKITKDLPYIEYGLSTPSGSFSRQALAELLGASSSVDGVLLAGDLGKNSETSLMLESFLYKYPGLVGVASPAIESFGDTYSTLINRPKNVLFLDTKQLRDLVIENKLATAVTSDIPRHKLAELLHTISSKYPATLVIETAQTIWVSHEGKVVDCKNISYNSTKSFMWAVQQPNKIFEALVTSVL